MATSKMKDFFLKQDDEVKFKAATVEENVDWESYQSKYSDILHRYWEQYSLPWKPWSFMGKDFSHRKDEISKVM